MGQYIVVITSGSKKKKKGRQLLMAIAFLLIFLWEVKAGWLDKAMAFNQEEVLVEKLAERSLNLSNRCRTPLCGDNIRLALFYLDERVRTEPITDCFSLGRELSHPDWNEVKSLSEVSFRLNPGELFAFHDAVSGLLVPAVTTKSCLDERDGYYQVGVFGAATCDLASLINWVACEAGIKTYVPMAHKGSLADIPDQFTVSIWEGDPNQNLYLQNPFDWPIEFHFVISGETLTLSLNRLPY